MDSNQEEMVANGGKVMTNSVIRHREERMGKRRKYRAAPWNVDNL